MTLGVSSILKMDILNLNSDLHSSSTMSGFFSNVKDPEVGAACPGSALQARGMWPSPASIPEVGSRPIQPAPGR